MGVVEDSNVSAVSSNVTTTADAGIAEELDDGIPASNTGELQVVRPTPAGRVLVTAADDDEEDIRVVCRLCGMFAMSETIS